MQVDWTYIEMVQKKIRVIRVENKARHVDAFDLEHGVPIRLGTAVDLDLTKIKRAKIYRATVKVYTAEFTPELEHQMFESSLSDPKKYQTLQAIKTTGSKPAKYELIALKN